MMFTTSKGNISILLLLLKIIKTFDTTVSERALN